MDGIGLELWSKKLVLCRYQRQLAYKACLDEARSEGPTPLYQAATDNVEVLILYWKETFQGSWQRLKPTSPAITAEHAQHEITPILTTEQKQIENEIQTLGTGRGFGWKPEEFAEGKALLERKLSILRASCLAQINDVRTAREEVLEQEKLGKITHRKELLQTRAGIVLLILVSSLLGVWLGATLNAHRSREDRLFVDSRMARILDGERHISEQLSEMHRTSKKIAFWTEKTPEQIDKEMQDAKAALAVQIRDIQEDIARRTARVESEYARSGRDGGAELDIRKQGMAKLQSKMISEAEAKTQKQLYDLEEQKRNIQR